MLEYMLYLVGQPLHLPQSSLVHSLTLASTTSSQAPPRQVEQAGLVVHQCLVSTLVDRETKAVTREQQAALALLQHQLKVQLKEAEVTMSGLLWMIL